MAQMEWAEIYDWQTLYSEYNVRVSTSTGNASIVLPNEFRKVASYPVITWDGTTSDSFPDTEPQSARQYLDTDKRVELLGNPGSGYVLRVYGVALVSGASVKVPYFKSPASLASPANVADIPNSDYLVKRSIAYLWESREDGRFLGMKQEADKILQNMIEFENVFSPASTDDRIKTQDETKYGFRIGRD